MNRNEYRTINDNRENARLEDAQLEDALRNFRSSVHAWSDQEYVRPRALERSRWANFVSGFWRTLANPALGGTLAAALLVASIGVPVGIHREHELAAERQAALNLHEKQVAEQARKAAAEASNAGVDDEAFLDDVDSDIAQATPDAMQPLASLMDDGSGKTSRR